MALGRAACLRLRMAGWYLRAVSAVLSSQERRCESELNTGLLNDTSLSSLVPTHFSLSNTESQPPWTEYILEQVS